jgi:hypothetical protein
MKPRKRDLALFNLAIDSKLRGCDLVSLPTSSSAWPLGTLQVREVSKFLDG